MNFGLTELQAGEKTWQECPQNIYQDLKKAIEGYYLDLRSQEVPTLVWENLYPTSQSKQVPRKASTTILLVGPHAAKIASDLTPLLSRQGSIIRPIEDEESLDGWDECLLQTIERDVWSRKITSLIGLYIQDKDDPYLHRRIYQKWKIHLDQILSKSAILRSYAWRGDLNQGLLALDMNHFEISRVSKFDGGLIPSGLSTEQGSYGSHHLQRFVSRVMRFFSMVFGAVGHP